MNSAHVINIEYSTPTKKYNGNTFVGPWFRPFFNQADFIIVIALRSSSH